MMAPASQPSTEAEQAPATSDPSPVQNAVKQEATNGPEPTRLAFDDADSHADLTAEPLKAAAKLCCICQAGLPKYKCARCAQPL
jgi:hypothetical protein